MQNDSEESTWKPLNNSVIQEEIVLNFIESGMKNSLIPKILLESEEDSGEEEENQSRFKGKLHYEHSNSLSLQLSFENITDLCSELFEIPSKRCSESFSLFKCIKIPNFITL